MKTDNIYVSILALSEEIRYKGTLEDYIFGDGIEHSVRYEKIKYILVKTKENLSSTLVGTDLNTNKKYLCELPLEKGRLFIPPERMIPFDAIYPNEKRNLSKRKIKKLGNEVIEAMYKTEQKNKK